MYLNRQTVRTGDAVWVYAICMLAIVPSLPFLPLHRTLHPRAEVRYRAEQSWSGEAGQATYRYRLVTRVTAENKEAKEYFFVNVQMRDLQTTQNEFSAPPVRLAGVFTLELTGNGGFRGLHLGGNVAVLGFPLVGWYVPGYVTNRPIEIAPLSIEAGADVVGTVRWVGVRRGNALLKFELFGGASGADLKSRPTKLTFTTEIRPADGRLVASEGDIVDEAGTTHFSIHEG